MERAFRQLSPSLSLGAQASLIQSTFVHGELAEEAGSHFKVRASRVEELESLEEGPAVAAHDEGSDHEASSVLGFHRLHKDRLLVVEGLFHEAVDLIRDFFLLIKECLLFVVLPVEGQVQNANGLPVVR